MTFQKQLEILQIPTDELTPSFFRGVGLKPPTRFGNSSVAEKSRSLEVLMGHLSKKNKGICPLPCLMFDDFFG